MSHVVTFNVLGVPAPQGSFKPMVNKTTGKPFLTGADNSSGYLRYRADLRTEAQRAMREQKVTLMAWAVRCEVTFVFPRPTGHFLPANTRRDAPELRPLAPVYPMGPPDLDKLCRSVFDALTGIVFADDAQVISLAAAKVYADEPAVGGFTRLRITEGNDPNGNAAEHRH